VMRATSGMLVAPVAVPEERQGGGGHQQGNAGVVGREQAQERCRKAAVGAVFGLDRDRFAARRTGNPRHGFERYLRCLTGTGPPGTASRWRHRPGPRIASGEPRRSVTRFQPPQGKPRPRPPAGPAKPLPNDFLATTGPPESESEVDERRPVDKGQIARKEYRRRDRPTRHGRDLLPHL
jgi:hypothetical protein